MFDLPVADFNTEVLRKLLQSVVLENLCLFMLYDMLFELVKTDGCREQTYRLLLDGFNCGLV